MRSRSIGSAVAAVTLLAGCGGHAASPHQHDGPGIPPWADGATRLVVVGDSLAAGRFAETQVEAFPQKVALDIHAGLDLVAAPGVTTAQLAARNIPPADEAVIEAGTNDFLYQTPRRRFA